MSYRFLVFVQLQISHTGRVVSYIPCFARAIILDNLQKASMGLIPIEGKSEEGVSSSSCISIKSFIEYILSKGKML